MSEAQRRLGANEAAYRELNERIETLATDSTLEGPMFFLCECGDGTCSQPLRLSVAEYERVRADSVRFVVAPGHEELVAERVVERHPGYLVVEKFGEAAEVAEDTDPRG